MSINNEKMYRYNVENIRSIEIALKNASLVTRKAISEENNPAIKSFTSLTSFLLGSWSEIRLQKLLYEKNGFTDIERNQINSQSSKIDQWLKVIELAFRKHFNVTRAVLNENSLPFTSFAQYKILKEIIDIDLRSVIEIRNKLAHGQWIYPLNSDCTEVETNKYQLIQNENLLSLQFKNNLLKTLAQIIHDLVISKPTFDRDFDKNYRNIINTRNILKNRSFEDYRNNLIEKRSRGRIIRNSST